MGVGSRRLGARLVAVAVAASLLAFAGPAGSSAATAAGGTAGVVEVSAGAEHSLALMPDGTVRAWGGNRFGQLGDGTTTDRWVPVQVVGLTNVVQVSAGSFYSLAVRGDGTVWSWGWNRDGQLGNGSRHDSHTPVQVAELTDVASVSAYRHSLALRVREVSRAP